MLGDVSGKGVPAALLMANLQACFRSQLPESLERPAAVLASVNKHFFDSTAAERFATLVFAVYDDRTRKVRYVNCAHCPPLLLRAGGEIERLESTATMLGAFAKWSCVEAEAELRPGDTLLLYSDGVTEAGSRYRRGVRRRPPDARAAGQPGATGRGAGAGDCGRRQRIQRRFAQRRYYRCGIARVLAG